MNPVLYPKDQRTFNTNGYGVLSDCTSCKSTEVLNGECEISVIVPRSGNHASDIDIDRILVVKPNDSDDPQPFRIYSIEDDIDGTMDIKAAHLSYDTAGIPVAPFTATSLYSATQYLNSGRITTKASEFSVTADFEAEGEMKVTEPKSLKSLLGAGENTLIGTYGGEIHYNGFNIELLQRRGRDKGICFRHRKNITEFNMTSSSEEMYTAVIGYWKKSDTVVRGSVISTGITASYDKILVLDTSDKIKTENDANATETQINDYVKSYIQANATGSPKYNMKISYTEDDNIIKINLGDTVTALVPEFGIKAYGRVRKVVYNCLLERNESIEVGSVDAGLPGDLANII